MRIILIFISEKRASASFVSWFLFPENNDSPKVTSPQAANSESNDGRFYRNFAVTPLSNGLNPGVASLHCNVDLAARDFSFSSRGAVVPQKGNATCSPPSWLTLTVAIHGKRTLWYPGMV